MDNTPCTPAADYRTHAVRADGWTAERQIIFLKTLAESGMVSEACREAGMSATAAYDLRRRPEGLAFALGWKAAILLARDPLEEGLLEVANATVKAAQIDEDGIARLRRVSGGLAMSVLKRLDRMATDINNDEAATARTIGFAFAAYLDLIAAGGGSDEVAAFLERHPDPLAVARARRLAKAAGGAGAGTGASAGAGARAGASAGAGGRATEAAQVAVTRKLVETCGLFRDDELTDTPIAGSRAQRRALRAKMRRAGAR